MAYGSISVKMRPLRLAFLVDPKDTAGVLQAIETASFLWGGSLNPIIPFYRKLPKTWEHLVKRDTTARSVLEGSLKLRRAGARQRVPTTFNILRHGSVPAG
jgi:hypothetical protein